MKVSKDISRRVLNIGPSFRPVAGGIAQVMGYYHDFVFEDFKFVANSCPGSKFTKLLCAAWSYFYTFVLLLFNRIDTLHIHTASKVSFRRSVLFARLGFLFRKKVIMHIHAGSFMDYYATAPEYIASALKKCHKVVALSSVWKQRFEEEIGLDNVVIINNIIPQPKKVDSNLFTDGCVHGLFLGAIKDQKGIFDLMEVIKAHKEELAGKFVLHIGGNEQVDRLLALIKEENLDAIVKFEGWVGEQRKIELMNNCHILFLPSYIEGVPICILEAMSYGMPVVTTHVGGIPSLIDHERNGFTNTPGDLDALWAASRALITSEQMRNAFGDVSLKKITAYYPESVARQLTDLYQM
ncbi:MAG: glycosyltransferase family 4 protein [Bacteroidales bacterium]|nr:glycosyltransferase family 4 protein [Bacteroidales bacterium]